MDCLRLRLLLNSCRRRAPWWCWLGYKIFLLWLLGCLLLLRLRGRDYCFLHACWWLLRLYMLLLLLLGRWLLGLLVEVARALSLPMA